MHQLLGQLGKDSVMFLASKEFPLPVEYRFLPLEEVFHEPPVDIAERVVIFLDCGNIDRMPADFLQRDGVHGALIVGIPALMFLIGLVVPSFKSPVILLIGVIIGFMAPRFWLNRRKSGRLKAFNKQLPDTVTLIANALRAGSSFLQAIELVVRESRPPISIEFGRVIREVNLGLPFEQALENMVRRVKSDDLELMATAIAIQHQVGGNLAEILDSIAYTIRERVRIKGEIRTLTAQQRLSGYVVGFLPIVFASGPARPASTPACIAATYFEYEHCHGARRVIMWRIHAGGRAGLSGLGSPRSVLSTFSVRISCLCISSFLRRFGSWST